MLVVLVGAIPGEGLHHVGDFLLHLGPLLVGREELPADHELLPLYALTQPDVVDLHESELRPLLLFAVVLVELHLGQQQLGVVVVLHLELEPLGHVPHHLGRVRPLHLLPLALLQTYPPSLRLLPPLRHLLKHLVPPFHRGCLIVSSLGVLPR